MHDSQSFINILPYLFLMVSILSLWIARDRKIWLTFYLVSLAAFFLIKIISVWALIPTFLLWGACYFYVSKEKSIHYLCTILIFLLGAGFILNFFPGIHNVQVVSDRLLSKATLPFTMYLNFKASLGFFLLAYVISLSRSFKDWEKVIKFTAIFSAAAIFVLLGIAFIPGFIQFDPKWPDFSLLWIASNLLLTSTTEEAFFRGFIQNKLQSFFSFKQGGFSALIVTSLLFGLFHFKNGSLYMILATVAGLFYGLSYLASKKIEVSILTHFFLNAVHFFFFSYPI